MLRLFGPECLDVSELNGDGWVVGHNLVATMASEQAPISETSINWLLRQKQTEILVSFGASTSWIGVQQAVRGFLIQEYENKVLSRLLCPDSAKDSVTIQSHVSAIGHWIALRASERELLPLVIQASQLLQVEGFDPLPTADGLSKRDVNRSLPLIYTSWAKISTRIFSYVNGLIEDELDFVLRELAMDRVSLARHIQEAREEHPNATADTKQGCHICGDNYSKLGTGLVNPRTISFDECRATQHRFHCECPGYLEVRGVTQGPPMADGGDMDDVDIDREFFKEVDLDIDRLCAEYDELGLHETVQGDPFYDAATMLYRAQGRRWVGHYGPSEVLCATCFLKREEYIGESGSPATDRFTPCPKTFFSACAPDNFHSTYSN